MIDVTTSVAVGRAMPVYGNHKGPESDPATVRSNNNQNLLLAGGFSVGGKPAASRALRRRLRKMSSGIKQAIARITAMPPNLSGLLKIPMSMRIDAASERPVSTFDDCTKV